jgi:hypothetical protein
VTENSQYKWTVVISSSASNPFPANSGGPFLGEAEIGLNATNPAPAGSTTKIQIDGQVNFSPPGFPDGILIIDDSKGNSVANLSLYSGDNPSNFSYVADSTNSSKSPVSIYVGLYAQGAPSSTFSVTLTIQCLNSVRPADQQPSPPSGPLPHPH